MMRLELSKVVIAFSLKPLFAAVLIIYICADRPQLQNVTVYHKSVSDKFGIILTISLIKKCGINYYYGCVVCYESLFRVIVSDDLKKHLISGNNYLSERSDQILDQQ